MLKFRAGSLLSGSTEASRHFSINYSKNRPEHERKKLVIFGDADAVTG